MINLDVPSDELWRYVVQLVDASRAVRATTSVKCASGPGEVLAHAGVTTDGLLWAATWQVDDPPPWTTVVDGSELRPRAALRWQAEHWETLEHDGPEDRPTRAEGYFAPLAIPPDLPQVYVPLYVRCPRHGDAVLDRAEVVDAIRRGTDLRARVSLPLDTYAPQRHDGLPGGVVRSRHVARLELGRFDSPAEFEAWRADHLKKDPPGAPT